MPVFLIMSAEKSSQHADLLVDGRDRPVVRDRELERAQLEPFHGGLVLAELAGGVDLHLDRAARRLLDVLLESERGDVLGLVILGGLEVGVLQRLLRVCEGRGEQNCGRECCELELHGTSLASSGRVQRV
jgi:hypothetical protein